MEALLQASQAEGPIKVAATKTKSYLAALRKLPVHCLEQVPDECLATQFQLLLHNLLKIQLPDCNSRQPDSISRFLISQLFATEGGLFKGIEMILQAVALAAVKYSVESVVESLISVYENHFNRSRTLGEEMAQAEMEIAINGPCLAQCNGVVKKAMDKYWGSKKDSS